MLLCSCRGQHGIRGATAIVVSMRGGSKKAPVPQEACGNVPWRQGLRGWHACLVCQAGCCQGNAQGACAWRGACAAAHTHGRTAGPAWGACSSCRSSILRCRQNGWSGSAAAPEPHRDASSSHLAQPDQLTHGWPRLCGQHPNCDHGWDEAPMNVWLQTESSTSAAAAYPMVERLKATAMSHSAYASALASIHVP